MSKINKNIELRKQFDDMIFEIVRTRTLDYSEEVDKLIKNISPQIEKINLIINGDSLRTKLN